MINIFLLNIYVQWFKVMNSIKLNKKCVRWHIKWYHNKNQRYFLDNCNNEIPSACSSDLSI